MNKKRNSLKVLSALFACCNLFSSVNASAVRKASAVSRKMEVECSLPGDGFKILDFRNGIRLVYTSDVDYNTYKDKIFNAMQEIEKYEKCEVFFCFSLGRDNPVVVGMKDYINIFFIKPQVSLGSNVEYNNNVLIKFVRNRLKNIVSRVPYNREDGHPLESVIEKTPIITVKYIGNNEHRVGVVKKSLGFLKSEKRNRQITREKDVTIGNLSLVYVKDRQDGTRLFKTYHNGQSARVELDKKGEVTVIYGKLGLGVSLSLEGIKYLYSPDLDFKTRKYIRESAFLDTYRSRTGKEFDNSLVNDIYNYLDSKFYGYGYRRISSYV